MTRTWGRQQCSLVKETTKNTHYSTELQKQIIKNRWQWGWKWNISQCQNHSGCSQWNSRGRRNLDEGEDQGEKLAMTKEGKVLQFVVPYIEQQKQLTAVDVMFIRKIVWQRIERNMWTQKNITDFFN